MIIFDLSIGRNGFYVKKRNNCCQQKKEIGKGKVFQLHGKSFEVKSLWRAAMPELHEEETLSPQQRNKISGRETLSSKNIRL
jgi:hypothetical protein